MHTPEKTVAHFVNDDKFQSQSLVTPTVLMYCFELVQRSTAVGQHNWSESTLSTNFRGESKTAGKKYHSLVNTWSHIDKLLLPHNTIFKCCQ